MDVIVYSERWDLNLYLNVNEVLTFDDCISAGSAFHADDRTGQRAG